MKLLLALLLLISLPAPALTLEDPTGGKPFFPWLWNDQFEPTFKHSLDLGGIGVLAGGVVGTVASHQYDYDVYYKEQVSPLMSSDASGFLSTLGGGGLGVGIAAIQLLVDSKNGLKTARAISLTALSQVSIAFIVRRQRPPGHEDYLGFASSFPSGHSSNAFATAASLGYAYGWWVGVPMHAVAIAISAGRISENRHWLSDIVAGAALGIFWAHASNNVDEIEPSPAKAWNFVPVPFEDGLAFTLNRRF